MTGAAKVAVTEPLPQLLTYGGLASGPPTIGARVLVPLGSRLVTGVVVETSEQAPQQTGYVIKPIAKQIDAKPIIDTDLLKLCLWVADYYEAPPGEAVKLALPPAAEDKFTIHLERASLVPPVDEVGQRIWRALAEGPLPRKDLLRIAKVKAKDVNEAVKHGAIREQRVLVKKGLHKKVDYGAVIARAPSQEEARQLARKPAKRKLLAQIEAEGPIDVHLLPRPHLKWLRDLGVVEVVPLEPKAPDVQASEAKLQLTAEQQQAVDSITAAFDSFASFLLHGITGSGKTEVYLQTIEQARARGRGAIVLVPEIALTPQLSMRFRARFGDDVAVLHSGLSPRQRFDEWQRLREGNACIAVGARSAVFAPVQRLGVIVVDEEHDGSFKQEEGVHYHARSVALVRAQHTQAVCLLGSATPSMESFHLANTGKHKYLKLTERPTAHPLPEVEVIDLRKHAPAKDSMLSAPLVTAIEETLARGEQTILFLNRRGYSTYVFCAACGVAAECRECAVSLTLHQESRLLCCHYCGAHRPHSPDCLACGQKGGMRERGVGTQKLQEALGERFPSARLARLDRDTSSPKRMQSMMNKMRAGDIDILIGTQMVAKGHDFPSVTLVGALCADAGLSLPDFRASERTFQLLVQVAGRAGRGGSKGKVIIQAYRANAPAISLAAQHDYAAFYAQEFEKRQLLGYPPHGHAVAIRFDGRNEAAVVRGARRVAGLLGKHASDSVRVLGPAEAPLARLRGRSRWHMWVIGADRARLRTLVRLVQSVQIKSVRLTVDVDPNSAL